jgi:hypothetical protein
MPEPTLKINNYYENTLLSTHDLMFRGHSLFFICLSNITQTPIIKLIGPLLLVVARQHYTIDVIGSGLIYYFIYREI